MPYKPSKPTGDSVGGIDQALQDHHAENPMTPDAYNASQGLPKSSAMKTPVSEVQRGIAAGTSGPPKTMKQPFGSKVRSQAGQAGAWLDTASKLFGK